MYADDTHTLILLIFIMSFTFVLRQIKCEKNPAPNKSFGLLAGCLCTLKGIRRLTQGQLCCQKKAVQKKSHLDYMSLVRDLKGWMTHTLQTPTLETQSLCSTPSICPFYIDTFTWITYSQKLSFQIALL